jgi:short-subunit dehydrogenase
MKAAPVNEVAQSIVAAIDRGTPEAYVPGKWMIIMMIIRHLPRFVFNKMNI